MGAAGGQGGCCWKSSREGEVERRGELSRGKVIGLEYGARAEKAEEMHGGEEEEGCLVEGGEVREVV